MYTYRPPWIFSPPFFTLSQALGADYTDLQHPGASPSLQLPVLLGQRGMWAGNERGGEE